MMQSSESPDEPKWKRLLLEREFHVPGLSLIHALFTWRFWRRVLIGFALLITVVAVVWTEENIRGKLAWQRYEKELRAAGEPTRIEDIIPPPVPDDQNMALGPYWNSLAPLYGGRTENGLSAEQLRNMQETDKLDLHRPDLHDRPRLGSFYENAAIDLVAWQDYFRRSPEKRRQEQEAPPRRFPINPEPGTPAQDIRRALSVYETQLEDLRTAAERPYSRFPIRYEDNYSVVLPHLQRMRPIAAMSRLLGAVELSEGDSEAALNTFRFCLRIRDSIATEPFLVSVLVREVVHDISLTIVWEGMLDHRWSREQLTEIEGLLANDDWFKAYASGIRGEQILGIEMVKRLIRGDEEITKILSGPDAPIGFNILKAVPDGFYYQNMIQLVRFHQEAHLKSVDPEMGVFVNQEDKEERMIMEMGSFNPYTFIARITGPAFGKSAFKAARAQAFTHLAITACALERYFLDNGEYPQSLDALVPSYTAALLHDPFDGKPLRYKRQGASSYRLYSVSENLADDRGALQNERESIYETLDLTWPVGISETEDPGNR